MGTLSGSVTTATGTEVYNLTTPNQTDWIEFPQSATAPNRKSGAGSTISLPTILGTNASFAGFNFGLGYTWTGGTPLASGTTRREGTYVAPASNSIPGQGFSISFPADTTPRTAVIYWGVSSGASRLVATLSDGSAPVLTQNQALTQNTGYWFSTITYSANSPKQTLKLDITLTQADSGGGGNVWIGAAKYLNAAYTGPNRARRTLIMNG